MKTVNEELKKELGNAIAAYGDILWNVYLGLSVPEKFTEIEHLSKSELKHKIQILKDFHNSL